MSISSDFSCYLASKYEDPIHNVFLLADTILLLLTSISVLPSWAKIKVPAGAFSMFLISYIVLITKDSFYHFANYALVISSLLLVVTYMIAAYNNELGTKYRASLAVRIFCIALILYHCGTFIVFLGFDYFMSSTIYNYVVDINTTLDSLKYLLIAIAFYAFKKNSTQGKFIHE